MNCDKCNKTISEGEEFNHQGQTLCDDCYMDIGFKLKACDPWAVRLATRTMESSGACGDEGLSKSQQAIYNLIKSRKKMTAAELVEELDIPMAELERELATLRHCELVKGSKEGDKVYLIPFS